MLRNRIASSAIVITGGLFASGAWANTGDEMHKSHDTHKSQDVSFQELDQNSDGYISQNEFQSSNQKLVEYDTLDNDNDGRVNETEFAAFEQMTKDQSTQKSWETDPEAPDTYQGTEPDPMEDTDITDDY